MRTFKKKQKGFTLIELLVAIVILVVGLVGVLVVIPVGRRASTSSAMLTRASMFAEEKMEELKLKGYETLTSQESWSGEEDDFSWNATISEVALEDYELFVVLPEENLAKIVLTVRYAVRGKEREEVFTTFFSEL